MGAAAQAVLCQEAALGRSNHQLCTSTWYGPLRSCARDGRVQCLSASRALCNELRLLTLQPGGKEPCCPPAGTHQAWGAELEAQAICVPHFVI